jgi:recombination endonuclease VII
MGGKVKDLTGKRFGVLTVVSLSDKRTKTNAKYYNCVCDCGNSFVVRQSSLVTGNTISCGCRMRKRVGNEPNPRMIRYYYGLSVEEYHFIFKYQNNCCALCQTEEPKSKNGWNIDHCHRKARHIGKRRSVRGILCSYCNTKVVAGYEHMLFQRPDQPFPLVDGYLMNPPAQAALKLYDSLKNELNMEEKQDDDNDDKCRPSNESLKLIA